MSYWVLLPMRFLTKHPTEAIMPSEGLAVAQDQDKQFSLEVSFPVRLNGPGSDDAPGIRCIVKGQGLWSSLAP